MAIEDGLGLVWFKPSTHTRNTYDQVEKNRIVPNRFYFIYIPMLNLSTQLGFLLSVILLKEWI